MFTFQNIHAAHSKGKSAPDFPAYLQDLISLGVQKYQVEVKDGSIIYYDQKNNKLELKPNISQ